MIFDIDVDQNESTLVSKKVIVHAGYNYAARFEDFCRELNIPYVFKDIVVPRGLEGFARLILTYVEYWCYCTEEEYVKICQYRNNVWMSIHDYWPSTQLFKKEEEK